MNAPTGQDSTDRWRALGHHWAWVLVFALVNVVIGLAVLAWPKPTVALIAVLFGIQLIAYGIYRFVAALDTTANDTKRTMSALLGVLCLIVGLYALRHLVLTVSVLAVVLGIFWIVNGVTEVFSALAHDEMPGRGHSLAAGVVSVLAGLVLLMLPEISLTVLVFVLGGWLVIFGMIEALMALGLRSAARSETRSPTAIR
jgi:uncharacterized membrane protein HdeD (DUF308 family)